MISPTKKCLECACYKPLKEFWGKVYPGDVIYLSTKCNTCEGRTHATDLIKAKQLYYSYVEALVTLGFASRTEICRSEIDASVWILPIGSIQAKLKKRENDYTPEEIETHWYRARAERLRRRILHCNGVPPIKPRRAKRIKL